MPSSMDHREICCCLTLVLSACGRIDYAQAPTSSSTLCGFTRAAPVIGDECGPLPFPEGPVICLRPGDEEGLAETVRQAPEGATIALAPGSYEIDDDEAPVFERAGVTLRSASGLRDVVVEGDLGNRFAITIRASNVAIANLTLSAQIEASGAEDGNTTGTILHDLGLSDPGLTAISVKPRGGYYADEGTLRCSDISLTAAGRLAITEDTSAFTGQGLRDWRISSNRFAGWSAPAYTVRSIFLFDGGGGNLIEGNTIVDFNIGIGVGQGDTNLNPRIHDAPPCGQGAFDDFGIIIANNILLATDAVSPADTGIGAWATCGSKILHNTLIFPDEAPLASIEYRFSVTSDLLIANNLSSHPMRERDDAVGTVEANIVDIADFETVFQDVESGDLHLLDDPANPVRDKGVELALVPNDIDGEERDRTPEPGADELP